MLTTWLRPTIFFSLLFIAVQDGYASGYIAGEFGSAYSSKEGSSFSNPSKSTFTLSDNSYGKVYEWGIAIGKMLSPNNSIEISFNTRKKYSYDKYTIAIDNKPTTADQQFKFLGKVSNNTFMIFYNYDIMAFKRVLIGLNTGYGWSYNTVSNLNEYLPNSSLEAIISSNKKKSSAYSFGAKINFILTNRMHLIVGYRYSNLGKFASGVSYTSVDTPTAPVTVQQITGNLKINEAYLRLAFFFEG